MPIMSNFFGDILTNVENNIIEALPGFGNLPGSGGQNTTGVIPIVPTLNKASGQWGYPNSSTQMPPGSPSHGPTVPPLPMSPGSSDSGTVIVPIANDGTGNDGNTSSSTNATGILAPLINWLNDQKTSVTNSLLGAEKSAVNTGKVVGVYVLFALIFLLLLSIFLSDTSAGQAAIASGKDAIKASVAA